MNSANSCNLPKYHNLCKNSIFLMVKRSKTKFIQPFFSLNPVKSKHILNFQIFIYTSKLN